MLKKLLLILLALVVVCSTVGIAIATESEPSPLADDDSGAEGAYTCDVGDYTLTVNKANLNLSVKKGDIEWTSGKLDPNDTVSDVRYIEDGLYVTYRSFLKGNITRYDRPITRITSPSPIRERDFVERDDGFDATVRLTDIGISFKVQVRLSGDKLSVTVPDSSIKETSTNKLEQIAVYPYFDSSYQTVEGKIFIPDGSGALIDLSLPSNAKTAYSQRVYGDDIGITAPTSRANEPHRITMPVVATMYSDHSTMAVAAEGAEYANVTAGTSGIERIPYNRTGFRFIYRQQYERSLDSNTHTNDFQDERNHFDARVDFNLMDEENVNIADVAALYRDNYLKLSKKNIKNVGMRLQFLMADNKPGMFGRQTVSMTDPDFVLKTAESVSYYCKGLTVAVTGYQRGGLGGSDPSVFPMANKSGYRNLGYRLSMLEVPFYFTADYVRAYDRARVSNSNLVQNISEQFVVMNDTRAGSTATFSLLKPSYTADHFNDDAADLDSYYAGLEATNLGGLLFSGFKSEVFSRTDLIKQTVDLVKNAEVSVSLSNPNSYMFNVMDSYVDTPIEYSAYLIETESVPFLQMVLGGYVPMYSTALNLDYTGKDLTLRLIDSNVYPSFILTEEDAIELYGTDSQCIFTSSYEVWSYTVRQTYEDVNAVLQNVVGAQIIHREKIAGQEVYINTYSNGYKTVVNYSSQPYTYTDGVIVGAQSAVAVQ